MTQVDTIERSAVVIGGGITGLSAAFRLKQQGLDVLVLEASDRVGGKMAATERDGFTINRGAALLPTTYTEFAQLAQDVGVGSDLRPLDAVMGVMYAGEIHRLRASGVGALVDGARTSLLPARSKLLMGRLVIDALKARSSLGYDNPAGRARIDVESVGAYCARRLNPEIRDHVIEPLLNGLFLADAMNASVADLFFTISRMLGGKLYGTPAGIDFLCRALARQLDVRTAATVTNVTTSDQGVRVTWHEAGRDHVANAAGCVLAVPGTVVAELYPQLNPRAQGIINEGLQHVDGISARFALRTRPPEKSLAIVIPGNELDGLASVILEHIGAPDCVPPGKGLLATFWTADWCAERMHLSDDELTEQMLEPLDRVIPGVGENLEFAEIDRWAPSNPAFKPGNHRIVAELDELIQADRRVQLAGDYVGLPLVNACAISGRIAAERLSTQIH